MVGLLQQFYNMQQHDKMKEDYCKNHNIPLLILTATNYNEEYILNWIGELQNNECNN